MIAKTALSVCKPDPYKTTIEQDTEKVRQQPGSWRLRIRLFAAYGNGDTVLFLDQLKLLDESLIGFGIEFIHIAWGRRASEQHHREKAERHDFLGLCELRR